MEEDVNFWDFLYLIMDNFIEFGKYLLHRITLSVYVRNIMAFRGGNFSLEDIIRSSQRAFREGKNEGYFCRMKCFRWKGHVEWNRESSFNRFKMHWMHSNSKYLFKTWGRKKWSPVSSLYLFLACFGSIIFIKIYIQYSGQP